MDLRNAAVLLALTEALCPHVNGPKAQRIADAAEAAGSDGFPEGLDRVDEDDREWISEGLAGLRRDQVERWASEIERLAGAGVSLVTVADRDYPANLRMIHNRPPFLFVRGRLDDVDARSIAIVGTRDATPQGLEAARRLGIELAERGITVISGLARGIDTAAHAGAMEAGGRTVAVYGTGIETVYPAENRSLARAVEAAGACVSQFFPGQGPTRWTFPVRNITTSGLSLGTAVVEAGPTSGAKLQASDALSHGKRLFLLRELVEAQEWATEMVERPEVDAVESVDEIVRVVEVELGTEVTALL